MVRGVVCVCVERACVSCEGRARAGEGRRARSAKSERDCFVFRALTLRSFFSAPKSGGGARLTPRCPLPAPHPAHVCSVLVPPQPTHQTHAPMSATKAQLKRLQLDAYSSVLRAVAASEMSWVR